MRVHFTDKKIVSWEFPVCNSWLIYLSLFFLWHFEIKKCYLAHVEWSKSSVCHSVLLSETPCPHWSLVDGTLHGVDERHGQFDKLNICIIPIIYLNVSLWFAHKGHNWLHYNNNNSTISVYLPSLVHHLCVSLIFVASKGSQKSVHNTLHRKMSVFKI